MPENKIISAKGQEFTIEEIENSKRISKSATPKQDLSWYIKWIASAFILGSMTIRGNVELVNWDLGLSIVGVTGWMIVGFLWNDRALIVLNGVGLILFLQTVISKSL